MTIDRISTANQSATLLNYIEKDNNALNVTQTQISSGKVSTTYAGLGNKVSALEAARTAANKATAYQTNTTTALNQADLQDTQLSSLSDLANQLRSAITDSVGNNDGSTLMSSAQNIFDQVSQILNQKDANGNYLYGGDKDNTPPFTATSLSDLASMSSVSDAFANGTEKKSVMVGDGQSVQVGVLASDIGTGIMQTLKDLASFDSSANGNLASSTSLTSTQSTFLTNEIQSSADAATQINNAAATNGNIYNQLQQASDNQSSMSTMYQGFVSNIEDTDMASAITQLNTDQTALQAALKVTATLNQVSLLNYLPNA